ncbi:N-acetylornithine aminotransferase [Petrocella atlantisensis]|uniref:Acetylornithine aminotransferase n=1 Tax=Petrocella atlantisensis TaxID=2173034 RepID=A0A3P7P106_9FIRM|nr:aspartate aminotransferase family protein [Petrocella atlantisensis]VDN48865.1 N-acetylornithine aminotransferase [Petrocella atlantisensis]
MHDSWIEKGQEVFLQNYKPLPIVIERGVGNYIFDKEGNKYLDFVAGIATNALGYSYEPLKKAMKDQIDKITHCSNLYYNEPSIRAAQKLVELSGLSKVFFCNSGAEANEAALKLGKRYINKYIGENKTEIVTMKNSFHGRTIATVSITGQTKYHEGFAPLFQGITYTPFNDEEALGKILTEKTAILMIEPIQGEGGIRPAEKVFLQKARTLCDALDIVLIFDEVQCGIGRTGTVFAYEQYDVKPDIVTLAKGLGAGYVIGAIIANEKTAKGFEPGTHASTFGGNPLSTTAAGVVLDALVHEGLLEHVKTMGSYLETCLMELKKRHTSIIDVRGMGLMMAIEMDDPVGDIIAKALKKGLMLINSGTHIIRFVPPLTIKQTEIDEMIQILEDVLSSK